MEYRAAYNKLNTAQKEAVDTIDGPVLVVAGPGTGKTQLLSLRVASILLNTDVDPNNIICLTFTNKAALNMKDRLFSLIGPDSRDINVKTFHSFAAEIMNQYPDNFWNGARLSVAPDAIQMDIIQEVLSGLPLSNPLTSSFGGKFTALNDVKQALKLAKEAGLDPEKLREVININIDYLNTIEPLMIDVLSETLSFKKIDKLKQSISVLPTQNPENNKLLSPLDQVIKQSLGIAIDLDIPTGKTKHIGKWKVRWVQSINGKKGMYSERKRNEWWLNIAHAYEMYRDALHKRGFYDYSDMLIEVLDQIENSSDMKADLQERYQYILIDEFQDTNAAQMQLANTIVDHYSANSKPNIMAVGDDDQSIFAFNGAELNNMLNFSSTYPDTKLIVLTENYRSSQKILDTADELISMAEDRLVNRMTGINKKLRSNIAESDGKISRIIYPTRQHELQAISKSIKQLWDDGHKDIAVLARKHESLEQLAFVLNKQGTPIRYEKKSNILELDSIKQLYLISKAAVSISEGDLKEVNNSISKLIRHPMWGINPKILWKLAIDNYSSPDWLRSLLESNESQLNDLGNWLVWLSRCVYSYPLGVMINHIIGLEQSDYLISPFKKYFIDYEKLDSQYLESLSGINLLRGLSYEFSAQQTNLNDFVRFIELNYSTNSTIADESWFVSGENAVELLTVYKAKGLEFDHVFVIDGVENNWQPRIGGRASPANLRLQSYGEKYDDYIRLLYVAITRARHSFTASSYSFDDYGKELLPTPILGSIPVFKSDEEFESIEILENHLRWPELNNKDVREILSDRIENYSLSQSAFIDFINVAESGPLNFLERHLLRLPTAKSVDGSFGTAIHSSLETAQRLVNTSKLELGTVLDRFEAALKDEQLSPIEYKQLRMKGEELLTNCFKSNLKILPGGITEQKFTDIYVNKAKINGKIDLLNILNQKTLMISDYKTGKPLSSFDTKDKMKQIKAWRHRNQLIYYSLLTRNSPRYKKYTDIKAQMIYLEAEDPKRIYLEYMISEQDLKRMNKLITSVWDHIMNLDFPDTSKYSQDISGIIDFENDLVQGNI